VVFVGADNRYGPTGAGTSFSSALVSGAAALIRSAYPSMPWYTVEQRLIDTAVPSGRVPNVGTGYGIIDITKALHVSQYPVSASAPNPPYARYQAWLKSQSGSSSPSASSGGGSGSGQSGASSSSGGNAASGLAVAIAVIIVAVVVLVVAAAIVIPVVIMRRRSRRRGGGPGAAAGYPSNAYAPLGQYPVQGQYAPPGQQPPPGLYAQPGQPPAPAPYAAPGSYAPSGQQFPPQSPSGGQYPPPQQ
jgi:hypothetical protein